jgi:DNA-binding MarR family transcriptional regulator
MTWQRRGRTVGISPDLELGILKHFLQDNTSRTLAEKLNEERDTVHGAIYALSGLGLIGIVRGQSSGTVYRITEKGRSYMRNVLNYDPDQHVEQMVS